MQPKFKKKLQLSRDTVRSLGVLTPNDLRRVAGGISRATQCNSKDIMCGGGSGGVTCDSADSDCPSGVGTICTC